MDQLSIINHAILFFAGLIIFVLIFIFIRRAVLFPIQAFYTQQLNKYRKLTAERWNECQRQKFCIIEPIHVFWAWQKNALEENILAWIAAAKNHNDIYILTRIYESSGLLAWREKQLFAWSRWKRRIAADRLGKSVSSKAITPLLIALRDRDEDVRFIAAKGLGKVRAPGAIPFLISLIESFKLEHCPVIGDLLIDYGNLAFKDLTVALSKAKPKTIYWLLRVLLEMPLTLKLQKDQGLWKILTKLLKHSDENIRAYAVQNAAKLRHESTPKVVTRMLLDDSSFVRRHAAEALGRLKYWPTAPALVTVLRDPDLEVRLSAAQSLHVFGSRVIPLVEPILLKKTKPAADHAREILQELAFK